MDFTLERARGGSCLNEVKAALPARVFKILIAITNGVLITLLRILERGKVDSGVTYRRAEMNFDAVDHASVFYDRQQLGCLERMDEGERV